MEQQQRQEQVQKASQALIQQMQVLQMTTLQLEHYLCEVYLDNPRLELSPVEPPRGKDARPTGEQWSARHDEQNPFDRINRRVESGSPGENGLEPPAREQGGIVRTSDTAAGSSPLQWDEGKDMPVRCPQPESPGLLS